MRARWKKSRSPELCEVKWLRRCDGKLPKTQQVQKLVDKLETEHANNAEKLSDGHMALLTQLLTLSEAAFKRQSIDVFNSQSQRSKQFLWIASLVIAADFALLNLSLTFFENPAIESIEKKHHRFGHSVFACFHCDGRLRLFHWHNADLGV